MDKKEDDNAASEMPSFLLSSLLSSSFYPPLTAVTDVVTKEGKVKEENDATSETPPSFLFLPSSPLPTPLVVRTYIITNVEAETAKEDKIEKDNGATLETP